MERPPRNSQQHPEPAAADGPTGSGPASSADTFQDETVADGESVDISLDQLSQSFARLLGGGSEIDKLDNLRTNEDATSTSLERGDSSIAPSETVSSTETSPAEEDEAPVTPEGIVEAILFVGHPNNEPVTSRQISDLIRGVNEDEVDDIVRQLNNQYEQEQLPFRIRAEDHGYLLALCENMHPLRDKFYGRVKEARLSQTAIDVLAVVAYHQPVGRAAVDELRGKPSGALLTQLVRRQLLAIERIGKGSKGVLYRTTDRFLDLFGMNSIDDLPRSQEIAPDEP